MYCKECGTKITEGNRFCEECGAPVVIPKKKEPTSGLTRSDIGSVKKTGSTTKTAGEAAKGKLDKLQEMLYSRLQGKRLIAVVAAIVVLFGGVGSVTAVTTHHKNMNYNDKLTSAQKYLDDGDYEVAIETFDKAIAVRPKKPEGYLAKASAQRNNGDNLGAIRTLEAGYEKATDKTKIEEELESAREEQNSQWMEAYRKILEEREASIRAFVDLGIYDTEDTVALCDLNEDSTPELLFFANENGDEAMNYQLHIYTYDGSGAREIEYKTTTLFGDEETLFTPTMAGGEECGYLIFKEKEHPGLTIYSKASDEGCWMIYNRLSMEGKGEIKNEGYVYKGVDYDFDKYYSEGDRGWDEELPIPTSYTYKINEENASEKAYNEREKTILDSMDTVILRGDNGAHTYDDDVWGRADKFTPQAKSYDEMMKTLNTKDGKQERKTEASSDKVLEDLNGKTFGFSSGAGAWSTEMTFSRDGGFNGLYTDSNMGDVGERYPNGTRYVSEFTGAFGNAKKTGEYEYNLTLKRLETKNKVGDTSIEDGVLIEYSEPYGLENLTPGDKVKLLAPGYPVANLSEDAKSWLQFRSYDKPTLDSYCILNEEMDYLFVSWSEEE